MPAYCCRCTDDPSPIVADGLCQEHLDERAELWAEEEAGERMMEEMASDPDRESYSGTTDAF